MLVGAGLQFLIPESVVPKASIDGLLKILGTMGLILIVLEGGLDVHITKDKKGFILRSLLSSFVVLLASSFLLAFVLYMLVDASYYTCFVNVG